MDYKRILIAIGIGAILVLGGFCYGDRHGQLKEILAENKAQTELHNSITKSVTAQVDTAHRESDLLTNNRTVLRSHIHIVHDTAYFEPDSTGDIDTVAVLDERIAALVYQDDLTIKALQRTVALQDTLVASLRINIKDRDTRIKLLESPQHISKGVQLGAGYCQSLTGGVPCVYVGYGVSFR